MSGRWTVLLVALSGCNQEWVIDATLGCETSEACLDGACICPDEACERMVCTVAHTATPGVVTEIADLLPNEASWIAPVNARESDGLYAQTHNLSRDSPSQILELTDFGLDLPIDSSVIGIEVSVLGHADGTLVIDHLHPIEGQFPRLTSGGVRIGNAVSSDEWGLSDEAEIYGGADDIWGAALSPAEVNHTSFGVAVSYTRDSQANDARMFVDSVTVTVHVLP